MVPLGQPHWAPGNHLRTRSPVSTSAGDVKPKVLVSAGSKHGASAEIADRIARIMSAEGCDVTVLAPQDVTEPIGFDGIVLGSAVYAGQWTRDARALARRIAAIDHIPPTWLFSSGPVGDLPMPTEDPVDVSDIVEATSARDHHLFAGKVDLSKMNLAERAIRRAARIPEGDFRDWDAIDAWARRIAADLVEQVAA
jgi:menaquinone-dependent protoporphyrinogen oxidase